MAQRPQRQAKEPPPTTPSDRLPTRAISPLNFEPPPSRSIALSVTAINSLSISLMPAALKIYTEAAKGQVAILTLPGNG